MTTTSAAVAYSSTISAARAAGALVPISMMVSRRRERLDLAAPLGGIAEQRHERIRQIVRRAVLLQEFRHHVLAEHQIGEDDRRQPVLDRPADQRFERRDLVGRDHRNAGEREFERHGAGLRQRRARDAEGRALLLRSRPRSAARSATSPLPAAPAPQDAASSAARSRPARPARPRWATVSPNVPIRRWISPLRLPGRTSRIGRRGEPPLCLVRVRAQVADLLGQRMPDIAARRPAEPAMNVRLERQQRRARGRHSRASCAHAPAARPTPTARHNRRSESLARRPRTRLATRWVNSGLSMITSTSGRRVDDCIDGRADAAQDRRKLSQDRAEPDDRELLDRKQAGEPFGRHAVAADAGEADLPAGALPQRPHQRGAEPVAQFFARDQKDVDHAHARAPLARG